MADLTQCQSERDQTTRQLADTLAELQKNQAQQQELQRAHAAYTQQRDESKAKIAQIKSALAKFDEQCGERTNTATCLKNIRERFPMLATVITDEKQLQATLAMCQTQLTQEKSKLNDSRDAMRALTDDINRLTAENEALKREVDALVAELSALEAEEKQIQAKDAQPWTHCLSSERAARACLDIMLKQNPDAMKGVSIAALQAVSQAVGASEVPTAPQAPVAPEAPRAPTLPSIGAQPRRTPAVPPARTGAQPRAGLLGQIRQGVRLQPASQRPRAVQPLVRGGATPPQQDVLSQLQQQLALRRKDIATEENF